MCRKLALAATAIALAAAFPALARDKPAEPAAAGALVKATAEARAMADRDEPVARAAFWAREVQVDPGVDPERVHREVGEVRDDRDLEPAFLAQVAQDE